MFFTNFWPLLRHLSTSRRQLEVPVFLNLANSVAHNNRNTTEQQRDDSGLFLSSKKCSSLEVLTRNRWKMFWSISQVVYELSDPDLRGSRELSLMCISCFDINNVSAADTELLGKSSVMSLSAIAELMIVFSGGLRVFWLGVWAIKRAQSDVCFMCWHDQCVSDRYGTFEKKFRNEPFRHWKSVVLFFSGGLRDFWLGVWAIERAQSDMHFMCWHDQCVSYRYGTFEKKFRNGDPSEEKEYIARISSQLRWIEIHENHFTWARILTIQTLIQTT